MGEEETHLEQAIRHVVEARKVIRRQRQVIACLKSIRMSTLKAEDILRTFEDNLMIFERQAGGLRAQRSLPGR